MGQLGKTNSEKNKGIRELMGLIRVAEGEKSERTFQLSFSSEEPYERWYGIEILAHSDGCVNLERLSSIGVVLYNHHRDDVIAKIERVWIEENRGYAEITFDMDDLSEKIYQKVKNGTIKGVSVGYVVNAWEEVSVNKMSADGKFTGPCSIARDWTPFEISIVSVPADPTVGVGRQVEEEEKPFYLNLYEKQLWINQNRKGREK